MNNYIEICFDKACKSILNKSIINNNEIKVFNKNFTIGDIKNIDNNLITIKEKNIRIYTSKSNIRDYLGFLYLCYKYNDANIHVIFTDDYIKEAHTLACITPEEIPELLKIEKKLTNEEINSYSKEWEELVKDNSEIRLFENGKVISTTYNYLDNFINENIIKDNFDKTCANMMVHSLNNHFTEDVCNKLLDRYLKKHVVK